MTQDPEAEKASGSIRLTNFSALRLLNLSLIDLLTIYYALTLFNFKNEADYFEIHKPYSAKQNDKCEYEPEWCFGCEHCAW